MKIEKSLSRAIPVLMLLATSAVLSVAAPARCQESKARSVPIFALLANPEKYDQELISTQGYVHLRDVDYKIYPSREFADHRLSQDGLWLNFNREERRADHVKALNIKLSDYDNSYVTLTGHFDIKERGRYQTSVAGFRDITSVKRIEPKSAPAKPQGASDVLK